MPRTLKALKGSEKKGIGIALPSQEEARSGPRGPFNTFHTAAPTLHTRETSHPRCRRTSSHPLHPLVLTRAASPAFLPPPGPIPVLEAGVPRSRPALPQAAPGQGASPPGRGRALVGRHPPVGKVGGPAGACSGAPVGTQAVLRRRPLAGRRHVATPPLY